MSRQSRFEICRGDDGWWARFRAANGRVVWVTETYQRRRAALKAIGVVTDVGWLTDCQVAFLNGVYLEIREVDER